MLIAGLRLIIIFFLISVFVVLTLPGIFLPKILKLHYVSKLMHFFSGLATAILDIKITRQGLWPKSAGGMLIVANHLSYLDIIILSAQLPCVFVTSVEMQQVAGLGHLAQLGGCVFVERRRKSQLPEEIKKIADLLDAGLAVVVFPEATSSNGSLVLPFKNALFLAAEVAKAPILPLCLAYTKAANAPNFAKVCEYVCWYGKMTFMPHLWRFCFVKKLNVSIYANETMLFSQRDQRKNIADLAHNTISHRYSELVLQNI